MANSESQFQSELLQEFRARGIRAFHISERFKSGILDLYVKPKLCPVAWIELKFIRSEYQKIPLTPLQRKFIRDEHEQGGIAGWCVCIPCKKMGKNVWEMYAGTDPEATHVDQGTFLQNRYIGDKWDVVALYNRIRGDCDIC